MELGNPLHRHHDLCQKEACRVVGQLAVPLDEVVESAVLHKLGDQVQITLVLEAVVQRHDERVAEPREDVRLVLDVVRLL